MDRRPRAGVRFIGSRRAALSAARDTTHYAEHARGIAPRGAQQAEGDTP
ncbi:hypothetical protein BURCENBC7_AP8054 [Burkholderia cenocepacia BC7]|nr:uncharacterized protein BCN122_I0015 [Burkholderia cenocepacia]EPZ92014.1 hypothetical protein BURCENK562V_C2143 [Burkholderia cenocepacia K56-2Valvano]ERI30417.1 hypothetical protein BURCENBC7_AP8054 [Burkholderia cenocepacia BC7]